MTSYLLEDFFAELGRFHKIKMRPYMVPPLGYNLNNTTLTIFQNEYISLYELLHSPEREELRKNYLDDKEKYSISLQVAKIFSTLHYFNPPICHGHLTSHNILLEQSSNKRFKVRIGDLELTSLHKFANTFGDYRNASVWSPPECL
jgi:serine/threonine protein kinase